MKYLINTPLAPKPVGPYSQGNVYRNLLFVAGQIGLDVVNGGMPDDFHAQTKNSLYNLKSVVEAAGSNLSRVLKVTVYLTSADDFEALNEVYFKFFPENYPARETVVVAALPKNAKVEVSCVAYVREDQ